MNIEKIGIEETVDVQEKNGKYIITSNLNKRGMSLTSQGLLGLGEWIEENRDDIEGFAEMEIERAKDTLYSYLCKIAERDNYNVERTEETFQVFSFDSEGNTSDDSGEFGYTIEDLKQAIGQFE
jgi:hypothetical protein